MTTAHGSWNYRKITESGAERLEQDLKQGINRNHTNHCVTNRRVTDYRVTNFRVTPYQAKDGQKKAPTKSGLLLKL